MRLGEQKFTIEKILEFVEKWLTSGDLNPDILADNFRFVSPFWQSNSKTEFINKFQDPSAYKEVSLSKIGLNYRNGANTN